MSPSESRGHRGTRNMSEQTKHALLRAAADGPPLKYCAFVTLCFLHDFDLVDDFAVAGMGVRDTQREVMLLFAVDCPG